MKGQTKIFITGATGYVGGSLLAGLLSRKDRATLQITALLRSEVKARKLKEQFGVNCVVGSFADTEKLTSLAAAADIVFHTALCDDLAAAVAILAGLRRRYEQTGATAALIHSSGAGEFLDEDVGMSCGETVYSDLNIPLIEALPDTAMHREVDLAMVAADKEGYVRTYIIIPSLVYGLASHPLVEAGIVNAHSILIPIMIKQAVSYGHVGQIGEGLNIWSAVDISEISDLYSLLLSALLAHPEKVAHGREGYYIAESDEFSFGDLNKEIGRILYKLGKVANAQPSILSAADMETYGSWWSRIGGNSRCRGERSRSLGWKPVKSTKDMLEGLEYEAKVILGVAT